MIDGYAISERGVARGAALSAASWLLALDIRTGFASGVKSPASDDVTDD